MDTQFYILLNLKTGEGHERFEKFFAGNYPQERDTIFGQLKGAGNVNEENVLVPERVATRKASLST